MSIADDLSETFKVPSIGNNKFPDALFVRLLALNAKEMDCFDLPHPFVMEFKREYTA